MALQTQTAEEIELRQKQEQLEQKESVLAELELTHSTLEANLRQFEIEYYLKVGAKYAEIDQLQATLDRIIASRFPFDETARTKASESEERADQSARDSEQLKDRAQKSQRFAPTPELKAIYRELAKLLHPDLAIDEKEKKRRHTLMQQTNDAYQSGDLNALTALLDAEKNNPERVTGDDIGSALVRVIRKIAQADRRITQLEAGLNALKATDLFLLYEVIERERELARILCRICLTSLTAGSLSLENK